MAQHVREIAVRALMAPGFIELGMADAAICKIHENLARPNRRDHEFQDPEGLSRFKENRRLCLIRHNVTLVL